MAGHDTHKALIHEFMVAVKEKLHLHQEKAMVPETMAERSEFISVLIQETLQEFLAKDKKFSKMMEDLDPKLFFQLMEELEEELDLEELFEIELPLEDFELEGIGLPFESAEVEKYLSDMKENQDKSRKYCLYVPYELEKISYENLTKDQKNFYFFWRSEAREGQFHKTQMPYLFLYIVECLHLVHCDSPEEALGKLMALFECYGGIDLRLDFFLFQSMADLSMDHEMKFYPFLLPHELPLGDSFVLNYILKNSEEGAYFFCFPQYVEMLTDFDLSKCRLEEVLEEGEMSLLTVTSLAVVALSQLVKEDTKKPFLETFSDAEPETLTFPLYELVPGLVKEDYSMELPNYMKNPTLRHFFTEITRLTENVLREALGIRGRLKNIDLPLEFQEIVTDFVRDNYQEILQIEEDEGEDEFLQEDGKIVPLFPRET